MNIHIRRVSAKFGENDLFVDIPNDATVRNLRMAFAQQLNVDLHAESLYYNGEELCDDDVLLSHDLQLSSVLYLVVRVDKPEDLDILIHNFDSTGRTIPAPRTDFSGSHTQVRSSAYFTIQEIVDVLDEKYGWLEAQIKIIYKPVNSDDESHIQYGVEFKNKPRKAKTMYVTLPNIRIRSYYQYEWTALKVGQTVLANYNLIKPHSPGFWHDFTVTKVNSKMLEGIIYVGRERTQKENCIIRFPNLIFRIEELVMLGNRYKANLVLPSEIQCQQKPPSPDNKTFTGDVTYGAIPGIDVGTTYMLRTQLSEAGIHISVTDDWCGHEMTGLYSMVLNGTCVSLVDEGDEFTCIGLNEGDSSYYIPTADQSLKELNRALAMNCNAPLNGNGAVAIDWEQGIPVRVVRGSLLANYSMYAPNIGFRYDGLYKVVKYYPERDLGGFVVWKYLLRRDDPEIAPWDPDGKEMLLPFFEEDTEKKDYIDTSEQKLSHIQVGVSCESKEYKLNEILRNLINADQVNNVSWTICKNALLEGKESFLLKVEEVFQCPFCSKLVRYPITLQCQHNVCQKCLVKCYSLGLHSCPACQMRIAQGTILDINFTLCAILAEIFDKQNAPH